MKDRIKKFIRKKRWMFTFLIVVLGVVFTLALVWIYSDNDELNKLYNASQIVSSLFVGIGVLIAGWQYVVTARAEVNAVCINQIQKAIDLSAFYKDNILKPYKAIWYVFERSGILKIIGDIKVEDMKSFDVYELNRIMPKEAQNKLKKIQSNNKFTESVIIANEIYGLNLFLLKKGATVNPEEGTLSITYDKAQIVNAFMNAIVTNLMNDMEFFAMHFAHETADDSVVYQSLHQTYVEIVQTLYYNISHFNKEGQSMYYTNVIDLYKRWYEQQQEQLKKIADGSRQSRYKGNIVGKAI